MIARFTIPRNEGVHKILLEKVMTNTWKYHSFKVSYCTKTYHKSALKVGDSYWFMYWAGRRNRDCSITGETTDNVFLLEDTHCFRTCVRWFTWGNSLHLSFTSVKEAFQPSMKCYPSVCYAYNKRLITPVCSRLPCSVQTVLFALWLCLWF